MIRPIFGKMLRIYGIKSHGLSQFSVVLQSVIETGEVGTTGSPNQADLYPKHGAFPAYRGKARRYTAKHGPA